MDSTVTLVGNLSQDPELKFLNSGQAVVKVSLAVNREWTDKQGTKQKQTSFFSGDAFGTLAENIANSVKKGDRVIVTGRIEQRSWETEKGEKRSVVEIKIEAFGPELRFASAIVGRAEPKARPTAPTTADEPF